MSRLRRFEHHRYLGTRDDMVVYDCDDAEEFAQLAERAENEDLVGGRLIQTFAPDTVPEAQNRGFRPR